MQIRTVTLTGADDSIKPEALAEISKEYPFVEWGILVSSRMEGSPRFPSQNWLDQLVSVHKKEPMTLSGHICGRWVLDILKGHFTLPYLEFFTALKRAQLNFHGLNSPADYISLSQLLGRLGKEFIFQMDGHNDELFYYMSGELEANCNPLFDISGGAGIVPAYWPEPFPGIFCGYAGGLGPHNLESQIERISQIAGDATIWIDMETHVRSNDDAIFDLEKVRACLEISKPWVK